MDEAIKQVAIQVPVVAGVLVFCGWLIRLIVKEVMIPHLDHLISLLEDLNRKIK